MGPRVSVSRGTWHVLKNTSCFWALPLHCQPTHNSHLWGVCSQSTPILRCESQCGLWAGPPWPQVPLLQTRKVVFLVTAVDGGSPVSEQHKGEGTWGSGVGTALPLRAMPSPFSGPAVRSQGHLRFLEGSCVFPRPRPTPHKSAWPQHLQGLLGSPSSPHSPRGLPGGNGHVLPTQVPTRA